ncbi:medium-chain fatty acid-CoA ligase faa2, partial [Coemansia sp. RSA 1836]
MNQAFKVIEVGTRRYWVRTALGGSADDMLLKSKSSGNTPVVRHEMAIAQQLHRFIIGTQGATVNSIQSETNARIIVPKNPRDPIKVVGTAAEVSAATQRIQQIVDANIQSVPYTHFISLPISDTDVQRRVGAFQSQIGQERLRNLDCSTDAPIFGYREKGVTAGTQGELKWVTYGEFHDRFRCLARGFQGLGMQPGDNIGIYAGNRLEWALIEFATYYDGYISVAIHETMGRSHASYIINLTELATIFTTTQCAQKLFEMREHIPKVKSLVLIDAAPQDLVDRLIESGLAVFSLADVEAYGQQTPADAEAGRRPAYDDVATIVFTSGTTDVPKGVILTHGNIVASIAGTSFLMDHRDLAQLGPRDSAASILPLSHILGRLSMHAMIATGCKTAFPRTAPAHLLEDLGELRPSVILGVPKFVHRVQDRTMHVIKGGSGLAGSLFRHAVKAKLRNMRHGGSGHWLWDHVIFRPLSETLGGRVRLIVAGTSAISREAMAFIRCTFSCDVNEGYGMTEACGPISMTTHDDTVAGFVGTPYPTNMVKLVSARELGYTVEDKPYPRGEIVVRGANIFRGYYRQPELTAEVLSADGWFRTGDLGMFDNM